MRKIDYMEMLKAETRKIALSEEDKAPMTIEFGGEKLPADEETPDAQLASQSNTLADINAMVPTKIRELVDKAPASIMFAVSVLLGGSKLAIAMQSMQSNRLMKNFFFNVVLLLAANRTDDNVEKNIRKLFSPAAANAAIDRLDKVYDELIANKTETDRLDVATLHDELAKMIRSMPAFVLADIDSEKA